MATTTNNRKCLLKTRLRAKFCNCSGAKLSEVQEPEPNPKCLSSISSRTSTAYVKSNRSTSTVITDNTAYDKNNTRGNSTRTLSKRNSAFRTDEFHRSSRILSPCPKIDDSLAVEKESKDPHQDFRNSMVQMIKEKEIESELDLQELLRCYLELNSPSQHHIIVQAFEEIWNEAIIRGFVFDSFENANRVGGNQLRESAS